MSWNEDQSDGFNDAYQPAPVWSEYLILGAVILLAVVAIWQGVFPKG